MELYLLSWYFNKSSTDLNAYAEEKLIDGVNGLPGLNSTPFDPIVVLSKCALLIYSVTFFITIV